MGPYISQASLLVVGLLVVLIFEDCRCTKVFKECRIPEASLQNVLFISPPKGDDIVFVSGRNQLYKISAQKLSVEGSCVMRYNIDSLLYTQDPIPCDNKRTITNNDNEMILQTETDPLLLVCGTTPDGMCSVLEISNDFCASKQMERNFSATNVTSRTSTVASFGSGSNKNVSSTKTTVAFFGSGSNKNVLFVASAYDGRPPQYYHSDLSARELSTLNSFSLRSTPTIGVAPVRAPAYFRTRYQVRYLHGFSHDGFAYYVTIQRTEGSYKGSETRLVRLCENDPTFQTYTELPISCPGRADGLKSEATIAISASLEHTSAGSKHMYKVLTVAFGIPLDDTWDSYNPSLGSELCFFNMESVEAAFNETIVNCDKGTTKSKLIRFFKESQLHLNCTPIEQSGTSRDACTPSKNTYIMGLVPLIGNATLQFKEGVITSLTSMRQNGVTVTWAGDNSGYLHKIKLHGESSKLLFWVDLANGKNIPIEKSTALDTMGAHGYFLFSNKVVKFSMGSCAIYTTCSRCLRGHDDPLKCGWCGDRCAHAAECPQRTKLVLDRCPVDVEKVDPNSGPISGGTMLTVLGDNFGYWWREPSNTITITIGGGPCQIVNWVSSLVKCRTPRFKEATKVDIVISVNDTNRDADKTYDVIDSHRISSGFEYKVASLSGVLPERGPAAGGTNVTIRGVNLDIGSQRRVTIGGSICTIQWFNETLLECSTGPAAAGKGQEKVEVVMAIDGVNIPYTSNDGLSAKFTYMPNPVIDDISPRTANFSEEPTIEVSGVHLDSVSNPRMVLQIASDNKKQPELIVKSCQVLARSKKMVCVGPSLPELSLMSRSELENCGRKIIAEVSFQMDGLHLPLKSAAGKGYFIFTYLPAWQHDISNDKLPEDKVATLAAVLPRYGPVAGGTNLTLYGTNLDSGSERVVRIGDSYCDIYSVSDPFLGCTTRGVGTGDPHKSKRITMTIDGAEVPSDSVDLLSTFTYKPDPVIYEIEPSVGTLSGLSLISVRGIHLDSAVAPFMVIRLISSDDKEEDHCGGVCRVVPGGNRMLCPIASMLECCVADTAETEELEHLVPADVTFRLDGVEISANIIGQERRCYCTYKREPHDQTFPFKKPEEEQSSVRMKELLLVMLVPLMGLLFGAWFFYWRVWERRSIKATREKNLAHVGSKNNELKAHKNGDELEVLINFDGKTHEESTKSFQYKLFNFSKKYDLAKDGSKKVYLYSLEAAEGQVIEMSDGKEVSRGSQWCEINEIVCDSCHSFLNEATAAGACLAHGIQPDADQIEERDKPKLMRESGHIGPIYKGTLRIGPRYCVDMVDVKPLRNRFAHRQDDIDLFIEEGRKVTSFSHPNVLPLLGFTMDMRHRLMTVTPHMKHGNLLCYIRNKMTDPTISELETFAFHVASGMKYLAEKNFVHGDLAARNCVLGEDFIVRIANFGPSSDIYKDDYSAGRQEVSCRLRWMAPESLEQSLYTHETDVWSYGVLVWELMTLGAIPYADVDGGDVLHLLKQGHRLQKPTRCPDDLYGVLLQCWQDDSQRRPSFGSLVKGVARYVPLPEDTKNGTDTSRAVRTHRPRPWRVVNQHPWSETDTMMSSQDHLNGERKPVKIRDHY